MKKVAILGVTGSIGLQSVDVILHHSDDFEITGIAAGHNIAKLEEVMQSVDCQYIAVAEKADRDALAQKYPDKTFYAGTDGMIAIATLDDVDIVIGAVVGFAGLKPTVEAIKKGKDIALANKETLVTAGHIIMPLVKEYGVKLLPVDSEHSAIFQSLQGAHHDEIDHLIITCSGGAFRNKTLEELDTVSAAEALKHPNWTMGPKITIDCATLFNKGLEVMEAHWLFDVDYDHIEVVIHPESVIHSLVAYKDTAVICQMGTPDMRLPIQYALTYPDRDVLFDAKTLSLTDIGSLHFYKPDLERFPALALAYEAGRTGGSMPCVLNGANEQANAYFREGIIGFKDIYDNVKAAMEAHDVIENPTLEQLYDIDAWSRQFVAERVKH